MSWIIRRTNYDTDERDFLINHECICGESYLLGEKDDVEWGKGKLPRQFLKCDEAYMFLAQYVRAARQRNEFQKYEDFGYLPIWYE